jgi:predicted membrane protein
MKPERFDQIASTRLLVGLWLIALGAIFLLGYLDVIDTGRVMRFFWPLVLVFIGSAMLIHPTRTRRQRLGWVFVGLGSWIFINKLGWVDINVFKLLFPGLLLVVGGMLVWRAFSAPKLSVAQNSLPQQEDQHAEYMRCFAVMSSNELRPVSRPFRGADLSAVMAGVKLNLLDARMETDTATIEVFAFWGGMEIHVPPDWTVISKVATLMGGFIDKRRPTTVLPSKTLIISGFVVMSGIEIKN